MKKLRKALSLLLAGVTAVSAMLCGSVSASAASKPALLTTALTKVDSKATSIENLGQGIFLMTDDNADYRAFYRIDSDEIKNWRSTGKLKATKLTVSSDMTKYNWGYFTGSTFTFGDYAVFYSDAGDVRTRYILKYDKSKNKLTQIYTTTNYIGVASDGSMSEFVWDENTQNLQLKILDSSAKLVKKLDYDFSGDDCYYDYQVFDYGSSNAYVTYYRVSEADFETSSFILGGHVISIDTKGKQKTVAENPTTYFDSGNNFIAISRPPLASYTYAYLTDKNKGYAFTNISGFEASGSYYDIYDFGVKLYGTKAIAKYQYVDTTDPSDPQYTYKYALVNVSSDKFLSAKYDYIYTSNDGEIFSVQNSKGQWGFLSSKGKKLAMFDDAGAFRGSGKYAPVIKSGKICLIDKNMKQASKTIKADAESSVYTYGDELFLFTYGGKVYFMTNKT